MKVPTSNVIKNMIITLGVIVATIAPFVHIFFPKTPHNIIELEQRHENKEVTTVGYETELVRLKQKNKEKFFGFSSIRAFLIGIGKPTTMLLFSIFLIICIPHIQHKDLKKTAKIGGVIILSISLYFFFYAFIPKKDFPKGTYFIAIIILSILSSVFATSFIIYKHSLTIYVENIKKLNRFIFKDVRDKYVKDSDDDDYFDDSSKTLESLR